MIKHDILLSTLNRELFSITEIIPIAFIPHGGGPR